MYTRRPRARIRREGPLRTGRKDKPIIQLPSVALRAAMVVGVTVVLVGMILFRLWFLQILSGHTYVREANDNRLRSVKVVAPRGVILDRNGKVLVDNRAGLAIGIRPMDVPHGQLAGVVRRLSKVLHMSSGEVRKQLELHTGYPYDLAVVKDDVSKKVVSYILEHQLSFPGVEVQQSYLRDYPYGSLAAHVLGYLGEISPEQLKLPRYRTYAAGDEIGVAGVEYTYDRWLRGRDGSLKIQVDAMGRPKTGSLPIGGRAPEPGDNLQLTIDAKVQHAAERALLAGINLAHQGGDWAADGGAAVAMDVHTGAVLALASDPTYDPAVWAGGITNKAFRRLQAKGANNPLLDRVIQEAKGVGSTFKTIDAVAGLEQGVITPSSTFYCPGYYKNHGQTWTCWLPTGHGSVNLTTALEESCDVYFYNVGYAFYQRPGTELEDWAVRLGLGKPTGIDLPGEYSGLVPTPQWRQKYFTNAIDKLWKPGNSINLAIGQGDLEATPLQMAVAYAAVANGGYVVTPHVGLKIVTPQGKLVHELQPPQPRKLDVSSAYLDVVRHGLSLAATGPVGTSSPIFNGYPVPVAGKTGTAEVAGKGDYSWYISFAPSDHPKYVVAVMIEQGGHGGSAAAPAARLIYDALFHVRGGVLQGVTRSD